MIKTPIVNIAIMIMLFLKFFNKKNDKPARRQKNSIKIIRFLRLYANIAPAKKAKK